MAPEWEQDPALLLVAARLAALPGLLPPPEPAFEQRVWAQVRVAEQTAKGPAQGWAQRLWGRRPVGGLRLLAPLAALLLLVVFVLPGPRQALSSWVARFRVGDLQVAVVPDATPLPSLAARRERHATLAAAAQALGMDLQEPGYLPAGYTLEVVDAVFYEGLPVWMQPLYVEATYRPAGAPSDLTTYAVLRQFNSTRGRDIRVGQIEFASESVRTAEDVTLPDGHQAVLVAFEADAGSDDVRMRQLIWSQEDLTLELWSAVLPVEEMLRIAASLP
jgi:hypothetical protein